jgi:hypothetical protein
MTNTFHTISPKIENIFNSCDSLRKKKISLLEIITLPFEREYPKGEGLWG